MDHDPTRAVLSAARRGARTSSEPLVLAISGGLDSMVLLDALSAVAHRRIAAVATFDHGTGTAATKAVGAVIAAAGNAGLPVVVGGMDVSAGTVAREATWRSARYAFLRATALQLGARVVTAHTEDDQVETVLMRIMRGAGARGIAALYASGDIMRPFVTVRRATIEAYAAARCVTWVDDPSNLSRAHGRNRVRHDLLPVLRAVAPRLEAELLAAARASARLRRDVDDFVDREIRPRQDVNRLVVDAVSLRGHDLESLAVLWAALAGRAGLALDWRGTQRVCAFTSREPRRGCIPLSGGWTLESAHSTYILRWDVPSAETASHVLPATGSLDWGGFRFRVSDGDVPASPWAASIVGSAPAVVRAWQTGDRLEPAAGQPRRRVRRYLSDVGVAGTDRQGWPVVMSGDQVVWIPGVRRSDAATARSGRPVRHYICERIDR